MWIGLSVGMIIVSVIATKIVSYYNLDLNYFITILIVIVSGFIIMMIFTAIYGLFTGLFNRNSNYKQVIKNANYTTPEKSNNILKFLISGMIE